MQPGASAAHSRLAALSVQLEQLEAKLADGADIDISEYSLLTSTLVRVVSRLGINRVARDIHPTLARHPCASTSSHDPPLPIDKVLTDPRLLGAELGHIETWATWLIVLKAAFGIPLTDDELQVFKAVAGGRVLAAQARA